MLFSMKTIFTSTLFGFVCMATPLFAQGAQPKKPTQAQVQAVTQQFQKLLQQQLQSKDKEAMEIMKRANANNGNLKMNFAKMQELVKKWSTNSVGARFQKLLTLRLKKKDPSALALMNEAKANKGRMKMTTDKMKKLVDQWEAAESGVEVAVKEDPKPKPKPEPKVKPKPKAKATAVVVPKFNNLFAKRIAAKDETALGLNAKKAQNGGRLSLSAERQKELIEQWEVAEAMKL